MANACTLPHKYKPLRPHKAQYRNRHDSSKMLRVLHMCHWKTQTGHILDWKTNAHILFQCIYKQLWTHDTWKYSSPSSLSWSQHLHSLTISDMHNLCTNPNDSYKPGKVAECVVVDVGEKDQGQRLLRVIQHHWVFGCHSKHHTVRQTIKIN